ncbi:MAG TPA: outer membrane protein assembly factor BamD [Syntrophales bacterium]|nr:outer membrane protein assembly factor BamD [Syntrophales bacterium]
MLSKKLLLFAAIIFAISGCAWWKSKDTSKSNPETLYKIGYDYYQKGSYEKAVESFQRLKDEYPLSDLAIRAEMGIADTRFSMEEYGSAETAYNDFVNLHPSNEDIPYVMHQIGMCHYKQLLTIDRDQTETWKALSEFEKLIARFPSSKFSFLAEKNVRECKKRIAEHDYYVGEMYFKMKKYKAAMRRFENILKNYSHLGLDYKVHFIIEETKKQLAKNVANPDK